MLNQFSFSLSLKERNK
uniref:Uncharacterized protein n=1 Tax=Rhizophora mucronata TaxID=61149 RepID=A0A2P2JBL9_RHIMU